MSRRSRFIVRVDDGATIIPFKGSNIGEILNNIEEKYIISKRRRR